MSGLDERLRKLEMVNEIRARMAKQTRLQDVPYALEALDFYSSDSVMDLRHLGAYRGPEVKQDFYRELHKSVVFQLHYKFGRIFDVDIAKPAASGVYVFLELPVSNGVATFYMVRGEMQFKQEDGEWKLGHWDQRLGAAPYGSGWINTEPTASPKRTH